MARAAVRLRTLVWLALHLRLAHAQPADAPASPETPEPFNGFYIRSPDGRYALKLGGLLQADSRFFVGGDGTDSFVLRRARFDVKGQFAGHVDARLQTEFAGGKLMLVDAYVGITFAPEAQLQLGKMIPPFGLELYPRFLAFPEFGLPSLLVANRDVGLLLCGVLADDVLEYGIGVFNGATDGTSGDQDENDAKDVLGRVFAKPFLPTKLKPLQGLGLGFAVTWGEQQGALPSHRTPGRQDFFSYTEGATAAGSRLRLSPHGYYSAGPFGLLAEYAYSSQKVGKGGVSAEVSTRAFQMLGTVVIGGTADYRGTRDIAPLDPARGTWGAVELGARYGELSVARNAFDTGLADRTTAASRAQSYGVAASWWLLAGTRAQVSFDRTLFVAGAARGSRPTESVLVLRMQAGF